jgi:hypothetical protein
MRNETSLAWEVIQGYGDIVDSPADCFDVEVVATFADESEAAAFAETHYENTIGDVQRSMPDWWKSYFVTARRAAAPAAADADPVWYAIYECTDADGYDADFTPCVSKEAAIEEARRYLEFASGDRSAVYAVAVPAAICTNVGDDWSLWDHLGDIPQDSFVWLHRGSPYDAD